MKTSEFNLMGIAVLFSLIGMIVGLEVQRNEQETQSELIHDQSEEIDSLKTALQTSNEKRGRLFLALLYTDIKGKEKELDSLLVEIGKDN